MKKELSPGRGSVFFGALLSHNLVLPKHRRLATLSAKEEFPLTVSLSPSAKPAPVIKEALTSNGVRLIARDNGASVRASYSLLLSSMKRCSHLLFLFPPYYFFLLTDCDAEFCRACWQPV